MLRGEKMAKQIKGVYERILECAKCEFLKNGYTSASLRVIAARADTTPCSIYTRFKDKEGLFCAIVEPVAIEFYQLFKVEQENFHQMDEENQKQEMEQYGAGSMESILDYIYDHFDEFHLLLEASYGTKFQNFVDELVNIEVEYTFKYIAATCCGEKHSEVMNEEFFHIITTAHFESMFEVVRHNMSREAAGIYGGMLEKYHMAGFESVFS